MDSCIMKYKKIEKYQVILKCYFPDIQRDREPEITIQKQANLIDYKKKDIVRIKVNEIKNLTV